MLVLADDLGFSDIGCYGSEIATPELDRLAGAGVRFTQFYNTGRCCPTRASLLTGLYPHQAGVGHMMNDRGHDGYRGDLNRRCVTLAEVLAGAGYRSATAAKPRRRCRVRSGGSAAAGPRSALRAMAAQVAALDRAVGGIRAALAATDKLDDTLFLFLADNGGCAEEITRAWGESPSIPKTTRDGRAVRKGNDPGVAPGPEDTYQSYGRSWANASNTPFVRYKHWVHEGGIASPLIVHWPAGVAARGVLRHDPAHLVDVMPTSVAVAGASYPETRDGHAITPMQGTSLLPVFAGDGLAERDLFFEHEGNRAVRRGAWKLVAAGTRGTFELYDMQADRTEQHDLAANEPERVEAMAATWQAWAERSAVLPLDPKPGRQPSK